MTYQTHIHLGAVLYPVIVETWGVPLSRKRFLRGCVKPDASSLFVRHPHFWKSSHRYLFRKIERLAGRPVYSDRKNKRFSEGLGIVLHYAADFFTAVHNRAPNDLATHLAYEARLETDLRATVNEETIRNCLRFFRTTHQTADVLKDELTRRHKAYKSVVDTTGNDIHEILAACVLVTAAVMDAAEARKTESGTAKRQTRKNAESAPEVAAEISV